MLTWSGRSLWSTFRSIHSFHCPFHLFHSIPSIPFFPFSRLHSSRLRLPCSASCRIISAPGTPPGPARFVGIEYPSRGHISMLLRQTGGGYVVAAVRNLPTSATTVNIMKEPDGNLQGRRSGPAAGFCHYSPGFLIMSCFLPAILCTTCSFLVTQPNFLKNGSTDRNLANCQSSQQLSARRELTSPSERSIGGKGRTVADGLLISPPGETDVARAAAPDLETRLINLKNKSVSVKMLEEATGSQRQPCLNCWKEELTDGGIKGQTQAPLSVISSRMKPTTCGQVSRP